jgi:tetratricopeptide (TPR) repeat protein
MLHNRWAREYLMSLFETIGKSPEDLEELVAASGLEDIEEPLLEIGFLRQGGSAIQGFNLAVAALALCREDAPLAVVAELIGTVEECHWKLLNAEHELPKLKEAADKDPNNGEKLAKLGFGLYALDEREAALTAFTKALEHPDTLCIHCHRDCLVNIGWDHYLRGEYEGALGWFEHACRLKQPVARTDDKHLGDEAESEPDAPYRLALENVLLALAKLGRLTDATARLQEYHDWFGRLPSYESHALEKLGLQPDVIFIRSRTRNLAGEAAAS